MSPQHLLDLAGIDVEAAGNDHVLFAIGEVQIAFGIDMADVAGMQPTVDDGLGGLLRLLVVTLHDQVAAHAYFTGFTARQDLVGVAHHFDADQRVRAADRGQAFVVGELVTHQMLVRTKVGDAGRCFGLTIAAGHDRAENLDSFLQLVYRHGSRAVHQVLHRGEVQLLDTGNFQQPVDHRWRQKELADPALCNGVQHQCRIGFGNDHYSATLRRAGYGQQAGSVGHRCGGHIHRLFTIAISTGQHEVGDERLHAAVGVHHSLWRARSATSG
ncbi:hypothetical protein D3C85_825150 [compost metagenome]